MGLLAELYERALYFEKRSFQVAYKRRAKMAGKVIISTTEHNTTMIRVVVDGVVIDRIEVDELVEIPESDMGRNENIFAKKVWDGTYDEFERIYGEET